MSDCRRGGRGNAADRRRQPQAIVYQVGLVVLFIASATARGDESAKSASMTLPGTQPLTIAGDIGEQMVAGVDRFLLGELESSIQGRPAHWKRDFSSHEAYRQSVEPNRQRLRRIIGARDERLPAPAMELIATTDQPALVGRGANYEIFAVRWKVLEGIHGEGLLLAPTGRDPIAGAVVIGDCEQTPEMLVGLAPGVPPDAQLARRLAEHGVQVVVPALVDRGKQLSVIAGGTRRGDVTHREMLYRASYQMGRHLVGFEVQKVLAAVDWLVRQPGAAEGPVGAVGYGEGGQAALYSGALDDRIGVVAVSGYFDSRQDVWREPIDRNMFGLLAEFGDAEIATLVAPRTLIVEACRFPEVEIPPGGAGAPGRIVTPDAERVRNELDRARQLVAGLSPPARMELVVSGDGSGSPCSEVFSQRLIEEFGESRTTGPARSAPEMVNGLPDAGARLARQYREMSDYCERLVDESAMVRGQFTSRVDRSGGELDKFLTSTEWYRNYFRDEVIGVFDCPFSEPNVRTRLTYDAPRYRGYEVVLDVFPDVIAYGILLVPRNIEPGEKRPVVVCQHGLEGRAQDTVEGDRTSYRDFAARLAERGFITFAPQHLYRGGDRFRTLQRKANPLKKTLFSVMVAQHEQLLRWLASLDEVDSRRIGFYGISYGGKSAMRIPSLVDGYCLSICSSDFSDWIWRTVSNRHAGGYLAHSEYEIFEFDLGNTFNYAEMATLICPRPFLVERFHDQGLFADRLVGEYAKVRLLYETLGIADRTAITDYVNFQSGSEYQERETFRFLHTHLGWPEPSGKEGSGSTSR